MPSLQEIRQFNSRLTSLGNEPEVVREWGEELEDVEVPDAGLDDDLSSLLSDTGALEEEPALGDEPSPGEVPPPLSELLDEWAPETPQAPETPEAAEGPEPDAGEFALDEGDFSDFAALLGETGADAEPPDAADAEPEAEEPTAAEDVGFDEGEFDLPDFEVEDEEAADAAAEDASWDAADFADTDALLEDISLELDQDEDAGAGAAEEAEPEAEPDAGEFDDFGLPEGFDLSDDEEGEEPGAGAPAEEGTEADAGDDAGLPDDDLSGFEFSDEESFEAPGEFEAHGGEEFSFDEPSVPGEDDGLDEVGDLDELGDDDLDEFSLGDFGEEFGVLEDGGPSDEDLNPAINVPELAAGISQAEAAPGEVQLTDEEFERLQRGLATLPLNLKQEVERIIAESRGSPEETARLCRMLVAGNPAQEVATFAGRIAGKRIRIPRGYEKRSGEEFERERDSFAYQFRENIWPVLRLVMVVAVAAGLLALAGYHLVFRPLHARSLYAQGIELIEADQHSLANQTFARAWEVWQSPRWYYEYADAFVQARQYTLAQQKYEELLFGRVPEIRELARDELEKGNYGAVIANHDLPKRGVLAAAELESAILGNYRRAEQLITILLVKDTNDYEARLALGDNYMRWAESDPARLEDARLAYARLIERYGQTDELLFRMLRYFIVTDNLAEVVNIKDAFQADRRVQVNPEIYADLAGYLLDRGLPGDVEDIVFRALDVDGSIPELHYHLARYYREVRAFGEEELALSTARLLLEEAIPFTPRRRAMLVDTHTRIGENLVEGGLYLDAQESFTRAINVYEEGRRRRILGADPVLARAYARLGDIFYYVAREYEQALVQFNRAEEAGYSTPDLDYKQGFVHYRAERFDEALREFRDAARDPAAQTNALIWATANTNFLRRNYFAAEAYYRELLDRVERERAAIRTLLVDEDPRHRSVIEYLYRGYNNLGVTLHRLHEESGEPARYSRALVNLTRSTELATNYRRDPRTLARTGAVDLAFLNQREALYPRPEFEMQIYNEIPEDLDDLVF